MTVMAELAPTRTLIPRWPGHGDLWVALVDTRVYARADQVERLAGIPAWSTGETLLGESWALEFAGHPYYELDEAIARCEAADTAQALAFLTWLSETLDDLLTDDTLELAQRVPGFIGSHPVRLAAQLLSADPTIRIGQRALFAHLHAEGWIDRTDDRWTIAISARRNGWLTVRDVRIPGTRDKDRPYPQIYVTPAGLAQLRRTLHALNPDTEPPQTQPTLFD